MKVIVDVPLPPEETLTDDGLKLAVTPEGNVPVLRLMVPLKPFSDPTVIVEVPEFPRRMVNELGEALMLKSPGAGGVTVSE